MKNKEALNSIAVAGRGIILDEVPEDLWHLAAGFFFVTIQMSSHNSSIPRKYENVPWPYESGIDMWVNRPRAGDYVDVVFKGGNSENPTIVAHHPGDATVDSRTQAIQPRATVPTAGILASTLDAIQPITSLIPGISLLNAFL